MRSGGLIYLANPRNKLRFTKSCAFIIVSESYSFSFLVFIEYHDHLWVQVKERIGECYRWLWNLIWFVITSWSRTGLTSPAPPPHHSFLLLSHSLSLSLSHSLYCSLIIKSLPPGKCPARAVTEVFSWKGCLFWNWAVKLPSDYSLFWFSVRFFTCKYAVIVRVARPERESQWVRAHFRW